MGLLRGRHSCALIHFNLDGYLHRSCDSYVDANIVPQSCWGVLLWSSGVALKRLTQVVSKLMFAQTYD